MLLGVDHRSLVAHIAQIVGWQDAEDVVQEAYVKVLSTQSKWDGRASAKTWLYTIARNCAFDWMRAQGRDPAAPEEGPVLEGRPGDPWDVQALEDSIDLHRAIERLKPEHQDVIVARMFCDSLSEAAELLGVSHSSLKSRYWRALKKLQADLRGD